MDLNACLNSRIWLASCNQKQYGCHRPRVPRRDYYNKFTERICVYCGQRRPASLEEQAAIVLLRNIDLLKTTYTFLAHTHHPQRIFWIIGRAINANLNCEAAELAAFIPRQYEPSLALFDVEPEKEVVLKRFLFYCAVFHKLRPQMVNPSDTINMIVAYVGDFDNDYREFWQIMQSAMKCEDRVRKSGFWSIVTSVFKRIIPWIDNEILNLALSNTSRPRAGIRSLFTSVVKKFLPWTASEVFNLALPHTNLPTTDERSLEIYVKIPDLMKNFFKPGINCGSHDYVAMKELQWMQKNALACPVVFKTRTITNSYFPPLEVTSLLRNVDPKWITYVALTASSPWSVANINELGRVLSACENLSSIFLGQLTNISTPDDMASAVSRLLGHLPNLQKIGLSGFPLEDMMERHPLPPVAELGLYNCDLTDADWKAMASRSDLALRELSVSCTIQFSPPPNLYVFVSNQAPSLESLSLQYLSLMPSPICSLLTSIAALTPLQRLHVRCSDLNLASMANILLAFLSIAAAEKLVLEEQEEMPQANMMLDYLLTQMQTFCTLNRRLPVSLSLIENTAQHEEIELRTKWRN